VPPRQKDIAVIQKVIRALINGGHQPPLRNNVLVQPREKGGLAMMDIRLWLESHQMTWIIRLLDDDKQLWCDQLAVFNEKYEKGKWLGNPLTQGGLPTTKYPRPWNTILDTFRHFNGGLCDPTRFEQILAMPLRYNDYFPRDEMAADLLVAMESFKTCKKIFKIGNLFDLELNGWRVPLCECSPLLRQRHEDAIPLLTTTLGRWNDENEFPRQQHDGYNANAHLLSYRFPGDDNRGTEHLVSQTTPKELYNAFLETVHPPDEKLQAIQAWIATKVDHPHLFWMRVMNTDRPVVSSLLHLRMLHENLNIGRRLTYLKVPEPNADKCNFCPDQEETHEHLFATCPHAVSAWTSIKHLVAHIYPDNPIDTNSPLWDVVRLGLPLQNGTSRAAKRVLSGIQGEALRAIWFDRCRHRFDNTQ
jgi:hypothetical protein